MKRGQNNRQIILWLLKTCKSLEHLKLYNYNNKFDDQNFPADIILKLKKLEIEDDDTNIEFYSKLIQANAETLTHTSFSIGENNEWIRHVTNPKKIISLTLKNFENSIENYLLRFENLQEIFIWCDNIDLKQVNKMIKSFRYLKIISVRISTYWFKEYDYGQLKIFIEKIASLNLLTKFKIEVYQLTIE